MAEGHRVGDEKCDASIYVPGTGQESAYWLSTYRLSYDL